MKVIFMAKETESSKAALQYLLDVRTNIVGAVIRENDNVLQKICKMNDISIYTEKELLSNFRNGNLEVDYILSFYWKRISKEILNIPTIGSINFHPGPLPEARGSGYHIAIIENWGYWGVTAHYMDEEFDTGKIIECRHFSIDSNIVNKDLVNITHKNLFNLFKDIINQIREKKELEAVLQKNGRYFSLKELESMKLIQENEQVEEIDNKIRAFWNPPYSGAQIELKGKRYTVINDEILQWIAERI